MSMRIQYSLRQGLAIALFGLPIWVLERLLAQVILNDIHAYGSFGLQWLSLVGLPLLGVATFALAFDRFDREFDLPFVRTHICWTVVSFLVALASIAFLIASSGVPQNIFHWARIGIFVAGLQFGIYLVKWIYFDWLNRIADNKQPPEDESRVGARLPNSPVVGDNAAMLSL